MPLLIGHQHNEVTNMTQTKLSQADIRKIAEALTEARFEISRVNRAAGQTVFNPSATNGIDYALELLGVEA